MQCNKEVIPHLIKSWIKKAALPLLENVSFDLKQLSLTMLTNKEKE